MSEEKKNETLNEELVQENDTIEPIFAEENQAVNEEDTSEQSILAELEAKANEWENRYLRLQADFENSRRRTKLDLEAAQKYRVQNLASDLLQSLDNFERALKIPAEHEETKSLMQGMEMVYKGIMEALKREGVEAMDTVGQPFDPHMHQAVMQVQDENFESNVVVEEFQKGYMLKDRVLRPAMVKVNE
ncbi:nucleotide exchange factor GrpE [Peribacillus acanthi]|uniref:nucleotide exchange factor GrpE n=1 Tax=Peribacillus acanthi TaxID=2171554 RepID=UPI000D3EDB8F|nr:nucleotide exchange factor GrpE [Peribacillus acanthi]